MASRELDPVTAVLTSASVTRSGSQTVDGITLSPAIVEVITLEVYTDATASANVTVTLRGTATPVAVLSGDTTTDVATKIAAETYTGWTASRVGDVVTFTASAAGHRSGTVSVDGFDAGISLGISVTTDGEDGDSVLVAIPNGDTANGPYNVLSGAWTRRADWDAQGDVALGAYLTVLDGSAENAGSVWALQDTELPALGTDATVWERRTRGQEYAFADADFQIQNDGTVALLPMDSFGTLEVGPLTITATQAGRVRSMSTGYGQRAYIEGLTPRVSGSYQVRVSSGAAWIERTDEVFDAGISTVVIPQGHTNGTLLYIYVQRGLADNPEYVVSTRVPVADFDAYTAALDGWDASTETFSGVEGRYVGHVIVDTTASDNIRVFAAMGGGDTVEYRVKNGAVLVSNGTNVTAPTLSAPNLDASSTVPATIEAGLLSVANTTNRMCHIRDSIPDGMAGVTHTQVVGPGERRIVRAAHYAGYLIPRAWTYWLDDTPAYGGVTVSVAGYIDRR